MTASAVQICNMALLKFGNITISSILSPQNKEERACAVLYPLLRDQLLYEHPWNFAMKRMDISAQIADTPAFEWDYAYSLPSDCLRVWELYDADTQFVVENNELLTNLDTEVYVKYISQITDTGRFSAAFVNCLATRLAAELSAKLSDNRVTRENLMAEYKVILDRAYAINAMEGNRPIPKDSQPLDSGNYTWQTEGR